MKKNNDMSHCVVTKKSKCGTFKKGDHIVFYEDGSIGCIEAKGWIDKEDADSAVVGMECDIDNEYYEAQMKKIDKMKSAIEGKMADIGISVGDE